MLPGSFALYYTGAISATHFRYFFDFFFASALALTFSALSFFFCSRLCAAFSIVFSASGEMY